MIYKGGRRGRGTAEEMTEGQFLVIWLTVPLKSQHNFWLCCNWYDQFHNHYQSREGFKVQTAMLENLLVFLFTVVCWIYLFFFFWELWVQTTTCCCMCEPSIYQDKVWCLVVEYVHLVTWPEQTYLSDWFTGWRRCKLQAKLLHVLWLIGCTASDHLSWLLSFILTRTLDVTNLLFFWKLVTNLFWATSIPFLQQRTMFTFS